MWGELAGSSTAGSRTGAARGILEARGHGGSSSTLGRLLRAKRSCRKVSAEVLDVLFKQPTDGFTPGNYLVVTTDVSSM